MTMGARCGSFALGLSLLLMSGSVWAQSDPPGAPSDPPGAWTDPPVRGAASPKSEEPAKSDGAAASREKSAPEASKPVESAGASEKASPPSTRPKAVAQRRSVGRSAKLRREQIRHDAARSRDVAENGHVRRRHALSERPMHRAERRSYAYRAYRSQPSRYRTYAWRNEAPDYDAGASPYRARRAGWGGLTEGEDGASRIARARAAGYIVMHSRTYLYPDGTRLRSMRPMEPSDPDDPY